ncbi:MAG TPA: head GIN domain-containing protein [Gemmatimonadota bacterium]|nr:head GIN domain-containing protein [Gemmatimonadota bacterium]
MRSVSLVILLILLPVLAAACDIVVLERGVRGTGHRIAQTRDVPEFDRVSVSGDFEVRIVAGAAPGVRLEGDDNLLPLLETEVDGGTLRILPQRSLRPVERVLIEIETPRLAGVEASGSSNVRVTGIRSTAFDASVSGSGSVHAEGSFGHLTTSVSGSGNVLGRGEAETITVRVSGSGDVDLLAVRARSAEVDGSGSGDVAVHVTERLDVSLSGSGDVRYAGSPAVRSSTSGSASVRRI